MDIGISEQFKGRYDGYMLLKFTSCQEFQQDFLDGKLFFNTADFFAQCDNLGRGDENEGNTFLIEHNNPDFMSANLESVDGKMMIVVIQIIQKIINQGQLKTFQEERTDVEK